MPDVRFLPMIEFVSPTTGNPLDRKGDALVATDGETFPVINGIPRFVAAENYAESFGLQWHLHSATQLDSKTSLPISRERLERCLGSPVEKLKGIDVLEVGCGAGRFTELLVEAGAHVHSIDLSSAVEVNRQNIGAAPNYSIAQADVRFPPFLKKSFDFVICLGVIQHTPSPEKSIEALWSMVKDGGWLVIDHYRFTPALLRRPDLAYRFFLKRIKPKTAKKWTNRIVDFFFPIHWRVKDSKIGKLALGRFSPCLVYFKEYPGLSKEQHLDLTKLDTFDHLTDFYKHYRSAAQIEKFLKKLNAQDIWVDLGGNGVEARCRKIENGLAPAKDRI